MYKSYYPKASEIERKWVLVDAGGQNLGRIATRIAQVLLGKHKPTFTPGVEMGDYVVVINAEKVRFSGKSVAHAEHPYFTNKMLTKTYDRYTGYPGGRRVETAANLWKRRPERILELAVRRMLPKSALGGQMFKKLKVYCGPEHPHQAQQPEDLPEHLRV